MCQCQIGMIYYGLEIGLGLGLRIMCRVWGYFRSALHSFLIGSAPHYTYDCALSNNQQELCFVIGENLSHVLCSTTTYTSDAYAYRGT